MTEGPYGECVVCGTGIDAAEDQRRVSERPLEDQDDTGRVNVAHTWCDTDE